MIIHNTQTVKLYGALQLQLHSVSRTAFFAFGFTLPSSTSGKKLHCQQLAGWLWASMNVLLNDGHEAWVGLKSWKTGKNQLTKWEHRSISHQNSRDSWVFIPQNMKDHRFLPSSSTVVKVEKQGRPGRTPWRRHHPPFWNQVKYQVQEKSKGHTTWLSNLKTIYISIIINLYSVRAGMSMVIAWTTNFTNQTLRIIPGCYENTIFNRCSSSSEGGKSARFTKPVPFLA